MRPPSVAVSRVVCIDTPHRQTQGMETLTTRTHVPTYVPTNLIPGYTGATSIGPNNDRRPLRDPRRDPAGALLPLKMRYWMWSPEIARAMISCWISLVPSKIVKIFESRCQRSTGYSRT